MSRKHTNTSGAGRQDDLPPHDFDAEEAVLASLLIDGEAIAKVKDMLKAEHFFREKNAWVYEACARLGSRGEPIDQVTVARELEAMGYLKALGGPAYLSNLVANCPTSVHIQHYGQLVRKASIRRDILECGKRIAHRACDESIELDVCLGEALNTLRGIEATAVPHSRALAITSLRKIGDAPPHYEVALNGKVLQVKASTLASWSRFKTAVMTKLDFIPLKPRDWDAQVDSLLRVAEKEDVPAGASEEEQVRLAVARFLELKGEGTEWSDLQGGCYILSKVQGENHYCFQPSRLLDWLKRERTPMESDQLWMLCRNWGAKRTSQRVRKGGTPDASESLKLWALPVNFARPAYCDDAEGPLPDWF